VCPSLICGILLFTRKGLVIVIYINEREKTQKHVQNIHFINNVIFIRDLGFLVETRVLSWF